MIKIVDEKMENKVSENKRKLEMLFHIPRYLLEDLAQKYKLPKSGKIDELRKRLYEKVPLEEIEEIYEKFEDAGNVTIHLFKFDKSYLVDLENNDQLLMFLKNVRMESIFKKRREIKLTSEPQLIFIDKKAGKIKIRLEARGKVITRRHAETREVISFPQLISGVAFIHTDSGLVEIRIRNREYARRICNKLAEIFNNGKNFEHLNFNEKELERIIKWAKTLRNVTIKPLSGRISSLRITAAQESDLRSEEKYKEIEETIGENIKTGIYVQYVHSLNDNRKLKIGFQINSQQGKIFFKTYVNEEVVDYVLSKIKEVKKL